KNAVAFSDPYIEAGLAIAVRGNEQAVKGKGDLKGKTVAVQQGSTGATAAEELKKEGGLANIKYYPTVPLAMMELTKGGADAVINDRPTSEAYVAQAGGGQIKVLPELLKSDSYGLAMKKGNTELVTKVNAALAELKAQGRIEELEKKHFAASATATTAPTTVPTAAAQ
ncbi:MAG TPA: transporter substrate-binding domain-containing protein, partial [Tepidisphaeraceae bacterium]|nr:transporter substrate-binding domain-containing protein [Tepidisphaeraceae bacterium]